MVDFTDLAEAIAATVAASVATSDAVLATLDEVAARLDPGFAALDQRNKDSGRLYADLDERLGAALGALEAARAHARDRREQLRDFRVAMFGRTGAGKSSLIEAITRGNASSVSPGQGDHTEEIREEGWGPLLIVDMPGTLGAGRRLTRAQLEARTEAEVKRADLVVLAFDSLNQQVAEFERAAEMVLRYHKPVIAVLNVRNPRWRSPDPELAARKRRKRDVDVGQHVSHLDHQLSRIGVHRCPIVAVNTQRATFARCDPYEAPRFGETRDRQVTDYGKDTLEESSNIGAFEDVIVRLVTGNCGALREAGLLGDLHAGLEDISAALTGLPGLDECEAGLERLFQDVGYPRDARDDVTPLAAPPIAAEHLRQAAEIDAGSTTQFEADALEKAAAASVHASDGVTRASVTTAAGDELAELERLRSQPFGAPSVGKTHKRFEQRMTIAFQPARMESLRRAEDAVLEATKERAIDVECDLLRLDEQKALAAATIDEAIADACRMLDRSAARVAADFDVRAAAMSVELGGRGERVGSILARAGGVGAGSGLVIAATNFWNPGGWVIGALSVGSIVASFVGSRWSKKAEAKRLEARARSIAQARKVVHDAFDQLERDAAQTFWAALTTIVASRALRPLRDAADRHHVEQMAVLAAGTQVPSHDAARRPVDLPPRDVLLGKGWAPAHAQLDGHLEESAAAPDPAAFADLTWTPIAAVDRETVIDSAFLALGDLLEDERFIEVRSRVDQVLRGPAKVTLCGDYSAAKSSLRAVATRSTRASRRRVKRGADPTTSDTEVGRVGRLKVLDTPGLGSPRPDDVAKAQRAIEDASLVLYLVTPRLIADLPSPLIDHLNAHGLAGVVARLRTRFLLTRIDELGASPSDAPAEFVAAVQNKRQELARVLKARGIEVSPDAIIPISPDPFGSDFDDDTLRETAAWNGIEQVTAELRAFSEAAADRRIPALAAAIAELGRIRESASVDVGRARRAIEERHGMLRTTERAQRDTTDLVAELRAKLVTAVAPAVTEIVDHVINTTGKEREAATNHAKNWITDPRVANEIHRWQKQAASAVQSHVTAVNSELERQFEAVYSGLALDGAPQVVDAPEGSFPGALKTVAGRLSDASKHLLVMDASKVLKLRDSLTKLPIPANALKFKPWGATKLAKQAKFAGKVAAVAGVAIEVTTIAHDEVTKRKHEKARRGTREEVILQLSPWFDEIMDGNDDALGVATLLGGVASELSVIAASLGGEMTDIEAGAAEARETIELVDELILGAT